MEKIHVTSEIGPLKKVLLHRPGNELLNLTPDTLRYYERIGLIPTIPRTKNGIRDFDEESCRKVDFSSPLFIPSYNHTHILFWI